MPFADQISAGWSDHATDAAGVAARLPAMLDAAETPADLVKLAGLASHVHGEHLGQWDEGRSFLERIAASSVLENAEAERRTVLRTRAVLQWCGGDEHGAKEAVLTHADPRFPERSSVVRLLAGVGAALTGQGRTDEAMVAFEGASALASEGLTDDDPAARSLAITGNNLACDLEERAERTAAETALMKRAAATARTWWEVAGDWTNVMFAEARLAFTHLQAGEPEAARDHAETALAMVEQHDGTADLWLTPLLALARVHLALGDTAAAREVAGRLEAKLGACTEQVRGWYADSVGELRTELSAG